MTRIIENIIHRSLFYHFTCIHNGYFVTDLSNNTKVMCDKDNTHVILLLKFFHQFENLCLDGYIQSGCRLIGDQKLRMANQTHCDHNPLTHTTGKFMRVLFHTFFNVVDTYFFQHFHCVLLSILFADTFIMCFQSLNQLISDRIYRIQTSHRVLEDHCYFFSTKCDHFVFCLGEHILSFKCNRSAYYFTGILK